MFRLIIISAPTDKFVLAFRLRLIIRAAVSDRTDSEKSGFKRLFKEVLTKAGLLKSLVLVFYLNERFTVVFERTLLPTEILGLKFWISVSVMCWLKEPNDRFNPLFCFVNIGNRKENVFRIIRALPLMKSISLKLVAIFRTGIISVDN